MDDALKSTIKNIKERIKAEDPTALEDALRLTELYPDEANVWGTLAYAYVRKSDYAGAINATTREMEIRPGRPALHFMRGSYALSAGDYEIAILDFNEGIHLGNHLDREPYREVLYFLRAEAYFQLGRKAEARADLEHVEDDCTFWTVQVRSKAELVALCAE